MTTAFVAGATSFTGRAIAQQDASLHDVTLHLQVRPGSKNLSALQKDKRMVQVSLDDEHDLFSAMQDCDVVFQLIGTVKSRFADDGDYEKVDYGTTKKLIVAAKRASVKHFILLSSVGAGLGLGSYLSWKQKTEELVVKSGLNYTLVRPSFLAGDAYFKERPSLKNTQAFMTGLTDTPFGAAFATLRPMPIQDLAQVLLFLATQNPQQQVLTGSSLFKEIKRAKAALVES